MSDSSAMPKLKIGVLGASGYTGADLVRLALVHPACEITVLTANAHAGKPMEQVFPQFTGFGLPPLTTIDAADWGAVDAVVCGLPHGTTQDILADVLSRFSKVKVIDMSADFRLRDAATYEQWYGRPHTAMGLQPQAVYGLSEVYRDQIRDARLIACPGCYPTAALLGLLPIATAGLIDPDDIVIDAKSGVSGAGRGLKEGSLFCEAGEGLSPYGVTGHRHMPEIEQELGVAFGRDLKVSFTPHLIPMSRGELMTMYVRLERGVSVGDLREALVDRYEDEPFVHVLAPGVTPKTQMVRGSNRCLVNVFEARLPGRAIVIATLDNLVKGSSGQALQNLNLAFGLRETLGLEQVALFP